MLRVQYRGQYGSVVSEQSINGFPLVVWIVLLDSGKLVRETMNNFIVIGESQELEPIAA